MERSRLQHELASVAMGKPGGAIADAILSMNNFDEGVPADDASCTDLINFLHWVADGEEGDPRRRAMTRATFENGAPVDAQDRVPIPISAEFFMTIAFVESGYLTTDNLALHVYQRNSGAARFLDHRFVFETLEAPTPEGLRNLLREARRISKDLRDHGLCERCPDRLNARPRMARARFCERCCPCVAATAP